MAPQRTQAGETRLPEGYRAVETVDDVIVRIHTAVGKRLQAVATRQDDDVDVHYQREDVDGRFASSVAELPPVPAEPGFVTYGDDERQLLWLACADAGMAVALDRDTGVNTTRLAEALYDRGIGDVELPAKQN